MEQLKTHRIPQSSANQKPSFLITVLDGTGSMAGEYDLMIQAYKTVFDEQIKSKQVYAIQFGEAIGAIEQFFGAGHGNFNMAFENILEKLNENIQADITICVVSDGREYNNIKALKQQIDAAKQKYQIQFTSIAVGSGYPFELFQEFRDHFHNGSVSCTNVQFVERSDITGKDVCRKDFINAFKMVRSQLSQQKRVKVDQQVQEFFNSKPTFLALEGSVVVSKADKLTTADGVEINETRNACDIAEFIQTSCQEFLKTQSNEKYKEPREQAKEMKQKAQDLYKRIDKSTSEHKESVNKVFQQIEKDLVILEDIGTGKLDLQKLSDQDKTKLLSDFNPQKIEIQEAKIEQAKIQEAKKVEQTQEEKQEKFQKKLIELLNEKSEVPGHMIILSLMSDLIDEAIEDKKSQKDILESFLNPKKNSLKTIANFTKKNQQWVEQFVDCYINAQS